MGGDYEQTVPQTPPGKQKGETVTQTPPNQGQTPPPPPRARRHQVGGEPDAAEGEREATSPGTPTSQTLRYHINGPDVHFHDDANALKASLPVADWYNIQRQVLGMHPCQYLDQKNGTLLTFTPYVEGNTVECFAELAPVRIGSMMAAIVKLHR